MSEGQVVKACIDWLCLHNCLIIRNNSGAFKTSYTRKDGGISEYMVRTGKKGSGDIVFCSPYGRYGEVECKYGSNKQQPEQIQRQKDVEQRGGLYILAYSTDALELRKAEILSPLHRP